MSNPVNDDPGTWPIHALASTEDAMDADMVAVAYANAYMYLHQAAAGQVPSGGFIKEDAHA